MFIVSGGRPTPGKEQELSNRPVYYRTSRWFRPIIALNSIQRSKIVRLRRAMSVSEAFLSVGGVNEIHGIIEPGKSPGDKLRDGGHRPILPLEAMSASVGPQTDRERKEIPEMKPRLVNIGTQTVIATFNGHDLARRAGHGTFNSTTQSVRRMARN